MKGQAISGERREHPRVGVMAYLENITYSILRKHGVVSELVRQAPAVDPSTDSVQQKGATTMAKLRIIANNDQPNRENHYPQTWLLYTQDNTIEVHVMHDGFNRPFVFNKAAA